MTIEDIRHAIRRTNWDFLADDYHDTGDNRCLVSVIDNEADECLAALRKALPAGASATFAGSSNTDREGDTTEDIAIEWDPAAMVLRKGDLPAIGDRAMSDFCIGWTDGDGTGHEGYNVADYFDSSGRYLGPDEHGIEPIFREMNDKEIREYLDQEEI